MIVKSTRNTGATDYWHFKWLRFPGRFVIGVRGATREPLCREYQAITLTQGAEAQVYFPLKDEPGISRAFSELSDASAALGFANRFGELGLVGVGRFQERYNSLPTEARPFGEDIRDWLFEARKLHRLYRVWDALRDEDHAELRRIIRWEHSKKYGVVVTAVFPETETAIANAGTNTHWLGSWRRGDVVEPAKLYLAEQFNGNMYGMASPMLLLDTKGRLDKDAHAVLRPYNSTTSLLGALWLEFGQLASGVRKQLPCESCGKVMDVTSNRSHKRKHDSCSNREKMARYRKAQRG